MLLPTFMLFSLMPRRRPRSTLFPYTTLFRSEHEHARAGKLGADRPRGAQALVRVGGRHADVGDRHVGPQAADRLQQLLPVDRKSTRLNSSHPSISYAVFCLKKKTRTCGRLPP